MGTWIYRNKIFKAKSCPGMRQLFNPANDIGMIDFAEFLTSRVLSYP
jgi:hypothetical protein